VERAVILCDRTRLTSRHLAFPTEPVPPIPQGTVAVDADNLNLDRLIKTAIMTALRKTENNQSETARLLGISRQSLIRRLEKYGLT
jgi:DNA-binding NtrC family response regulator